MTVVVRETKETTIRCELTRGTGRATVATGQPFLDHMLVAFARYAGLDLTLQATGDLPHHLIEDVAICLGAALAALLPATAARYGDRTIPMDDALVHCALDLGGRPYYRGPAAEHALRPLHALVQRQREGDAAPARAARHRPAPRRRGGVQGARPRRARGVRRLGRRVQHEGRRRPARRGASRC